MAAGQSIQYIRSAFASPVLFLAPGGGLGHLVRCSALALALRQKHIPTIIFSTSRCGQGLSRICKIPVISVAPRLWKVKIPELIAEFKPRLMVVDSFPFGFLGFKGENLEEFAARIPIVHLARRLRVEQYLAQLGKPWPATSGCLKNVMVIEKLSPVHMALLAKSAENIRVLAGPISFCHEDITPPGLPGELKRLLNEQEMHLVVHGGPEREIQLLIETALNNMREKRRGAIVILNPFINLMEYPVFDYFPAAICYKKAHHIYTGAGYNSMAETRLFQEKHTAIAFPRNFDDQAARVVDFFQGVASGNNQAVDFILNCLR